MNTRIPYATPDACFDAASSPAAAPEVTAGGTTFGTQEAIERYRMIACLSQLKLESKGIRMSRGRSALQVARQSYGIQARTAAKAYSLLRAIMIERGIITGEYV